MTTSEETSFTELNCRNKLSLSHLAMETEPEALLEGAKKRKEADIYPLNFNIFQTWAHLSSRPSFKFGQTMLNFTG